MPLYSGHIPTTRMSGRMISDKPIGTIKKVTTSGSILIDKIKGRIYIKS